MTDDLETAYSALFANAKSPAEQAAIRDQYARAVMERTQYQRGLQAQQFGEGQRQFNVGSNLAQNRLATGLQAVSQPNPFLMGNQTRGMSSYFGQPNWSGGNAPSRQYGYAAPDKPNNLLSMGGFGADNDFSTQVKNYLSRLMGA